MALKLNIEFRPDLSHLKAAFASIGKMPEINGLADGFERAKPAATAFTTAANAAAESVQRQKEGLAQMIVSGAKGSAEFKAAEKSLQAAAVEAGKYDKALLEAEKAALGVGSATEKARQQGSGLGKIFDFNQTTQAVSTISNSVNQLTEPFIKLDTATRNIGALGVKNLDELSATFTDLSKTIPNDASEIGDAVGEAIGSGIIKTGENGKVATAEVEKFAKTAAQLAVAGQASIGEAGKGIGSILNSYGLEAGKADEISKVLFNTFNYGSVSVKELAQYMPQVTGAASALNITTGQLGGAYATMTKQGLGAGDTTTKLKAFFTEIQKPGKDLAAVMDKAGLSIGQLKSGELTLQQFAAKIKDASDAAGKGTEIFGSVEAAAVTLALGGDKAAGAMEDLNGVINDSTAVGKGFEVQSESMAVKAKLMENAFSGTVNSILGSTGSLGAGAVAASKVFGSLNGQITAIAGLKNIIPVDMFKGGLSQAAGFGKSLLSTVIPSLATTGATTTATGAAFTGMWAAALAPIAAVVAGVAAVAIASHLISDALHDTAEEKLADAKADADALVAKKETIAAHQEQLSGQAALVEEYKKLSSQTTLTSAEQQKLVDVSQQLNLAFPGTVSGSAAAADNMKNLESATGGLADQIITTGAEMLELDKKIAENAKIQIGLEVDLSKENLENQLTESMDKGFFDSVKGILSGDMKNLGANLSNAAHLGFDQEIQEFFTGTSVDRKGAENFVKSFSDSVYNAKNAGDIIKAQADFAQKITLDGDKMNMSKEEQAKAIKGFNDYAQKRQAQLKQLAENDKKINADTAANVADTFAKATGAGKSVSDTLKDMSSNFHLSEDKIKKIAFDDALKKATKEGKITDAQVAELAKKFNKTAEEVKGLVVEQQKSNSEMSKTKSLAEEVAGSFDKAASAAKSGYKAQTDSLNDLTLARNKALRDGDTERAKQLAETIGQTRQKQRADYNEQLKIDKIAEGNDLIANTKKREARKKASEDALKDFTKSLADIGKEQAAGQDKSNAVALASIVKLRDEVARRVAQELPPIAIAGLNFGAVYQDVAELDTLAKSLVLDDVSAKMDAELNKALAAAENNLKQLKSTGKAMKDELIKAEAGFEAKKAELRIDYAARSEKALAEAAKDYDAKQRLAHIESLAQTAADEKQSIARRLGASDEEFAGRESLLREELAKTVLTEEQKNLILERFGNERLAKQKKLYSDIDVQRAELEKFEISMQDESLEKKIALYDIEREANRKALEKQADDMRATEESKLQMLSKFDERTLVERSKMLIESNALYQAAATFQLNIEKQFSDEAIKERRRASKESDKALADSEEALFQSLKNKLADEKSYYADLAEIEAKRAQAAADSLDFFKLANSALIDSLKAATADARKTLAESAKALKTLYSTQAKDEADATKLHAAQQKARDKVLEDTVTAAGLGFATMVASGEDAMTAAGKAALGAAADYLTSMMPVWVASIFGSFASSGPVGIALFGVTVGVLTGLVQAARAALVGADKGVIGITREYSTKPSARDTIPVLVRDGESIINTEATAVNRDVLHFINSTNRPAQEFFTRAGYDSPETKRAAHDPVEVESLRRQLEEIQAIHTREVSEWQANFEEIKNTVIAVSVHNNNDTNTSELLVELQQQTDLAGKLLADNKAMRAQMRQQQRGEKNRAPVPIKVNVSVPNSNSNWS